MKKFLICGAVAILVLTIGHFAAELSKERKTIVYETFKGSHGLTEHYYKNIVVQDTGHIKLIKQIREVKGV